MCLNAFGGMGVAQLMMAALTFFVGVIIAVFFLKRLLAWMDERGWITYTGHVPTYGTLGNSFLELQSLAQPEKQYVIEMKQKEKDRKDQDDATGSDDPANKSSVQATDEKEKEPNRE